jgi:hypothetical protein
MPGGYDASISALAEFLDELVLGVDDEGGIEGGEAVALHSGGNKRNASWDKEDKGLE